ncbi:MAG: FAD-dependent oxidoreductase [Pseudomonadota bacterium]|nr:FAD-dependent oxidoreductase [Pseudomonadota bacterium]
MVDTQSRSIAIVGSGPGGMYVAQALVEKAPGSKIDIIDRLPTPFGLIRGGVAPDHQHTKRVDKKYSSTISLNEKVRFIGNVSLDRDVSIHELTKIYDAVVLAYGAPYDKKLGIKGEDKKNVFGSNAFVGWYNCHPDFINLNPDLKINSAVVIGIGNVAIDVARVLSRTTTEMATTDIGEYAMKAIEVSPLKEVYMFGRRGPIEAAFTNTELKELGAMEAAATTVEFAQLPSQVPNNLDDKEKKVKGRILETLKELSEAKLGEKRRAIKIKFFASPVKILGNEQVEGIRMEKTEVKNGRCIGTGKTFDVPCEMVITCIGSRAEPIKGVPFDTKAGIVTHKDGRIAPRIYAAGWVKRGAVGTIGTNRLDSYDVADIIISDFKGDRRPGPDLFDSLIDSRKLRQVSFEDWLAIKQSEEEAATPPAPRRKFNTVEQMIQNLNQKT